jgi:hypothetical protein
MSNTKKRREQREQEAKTRKRKRNKIIFFSAFATIFIIVLIVIININTDDDPRRVPNRPKTSKEEIFAYFSPITEFQIKDVSYDYPYAEENPKIKEAVNFMAGLVDVRDDGSENWIGKWYLDTAKNLKIIIKIADSSAEGLFDFVENSITFGQHVENMSKIDWVMILFHELTHAFDLLLGLRAYEDLYLSEIYSYVDIIMNKERKAFAYNTFLAIKLRTLVWEVKSLQYIDLVKKLYSRIKYRNILAVDIIKEASKTFDIHSYEFYERRTKNLFIKTMDNRIMMLNDIIARIREKKPDISEDAIRALLFGMHCEYHDIIIYKIQNYDYINNVISKNQTFKYLYIETTFEKFDTYANSKRDIDIIKIPDAEKIYDLKSKIIDLRKEYKEYSQIETVLNRKVWKPLGRELY